MTLLNQIQELTEDLYNLATETPNDYQLDLALKELLKVTILVWATTNEELLSALLEVKLPEDIAQMVTDTDVLPIVLSSLWQPIETAPKEEDVLVYVPKVGGYMTCAYLRMSNVWMSNTSNDALTPTYWMPLPKEPNL
jgi:hypothetical protein